jgi:AcrR family transcriptional regulator
MNTTSNISEKQLKIIEAAGKILTTGGIGGLTTKNLGKEMQSSESAIYRHFASKEEIIIGLLDYLCESLDEKYTLGISKNDNPEQQFKDLFQLQLEYFTNNPHFVVAVFSDGLLEESDKINAAILRIMAMKQKHLLPIIQSGQAAGIFTTDLSVEDILHISMGTIRLQMFKWRVADFKFDIRQKGNDIIKSLIHLLKK